MKEILASGLTLLLLASCGGPNTGGGNGGGSGGGNGGGAGTGGFTSLSGKVYELSTDASGVKSGVAWKSGAKTVDLVVPVDYTTGATKVISSGTISAAGDLSISLPATNIPTLPITDYKPVTDAPNSPYIYECTGGFTAGNTSVKMVGGGLQVGTQGILTGFKDASSLSNLYPEGKVSLTNLLYVDGATSWSGSVTCTMKDKATKAVLMTTKTTMNVQLVKGWNVLSGEMTISSDYKSVNTTMTTLSTAPTVWVANGIN